MCTFHPANCTGWDSEGVKGFVYRSFSLQAPLVWNNIPPYITRYSSVQINTSGIYALGEAHRDNPVSQKCPQRCLSNSFNVRLTADDPLSSFQERSSNASSFHASLFHVIDGVLQFSFTVQNFS